MFSAGGVRGVVNRDLTPEAALDLGRAVGRTFPGTVAVACDARDSSPMVRSALVSGIMSVGTDVVDLGMVPTPALQLYVSRHPEVSGGAMVTASHSTREYNGLKLFLADGMEATTEDEAALASMYAREAPDAPAAEVGVLRRETGAAEDYVEEVLSHVDADAIRSAGLRVCADCANGAASVTTPLLLSRLGVDSVTIGCDTAGRPHRESDPVPANLSGIRGMTPLARADLGVAHDGDGGRSIFIDPEGNPIPGDVSGALVARSVLSEHKGKVVTPVSSSMVLQDTVEASGGLVKYTVVVTHEVVRKMVENKAVFGVEEHGGMIFPEMQMARDGGMALAKMLEIVAKGGPLEDQLAELPRYATVKLSVPCPDGAKRQLMDRFAEEAEGERTDTTDGLKLFLDDGWVLLRPSSTSEVVRVYSESRDREVAESRARRFAEEAEVFVASWSATRRRRPSVLACTARTSLMSLAARIDVIPDGSAGGQTSLTSKPTSLSPMMFIAFFTSIGVRPNGSGVPVPGAYAGSIPSMSSVR